MAALSYIFRITSLKMLSSSWKNHYLPHIPIGTHVPNTYHQVLELDFICLSLISEFPQSKSVHSCLHSHTDEEEATVRKILFDIYM